MLVKVCSKTATPELLEGNYSHTFVNELSRQITEEISRAMSIRGLDESTLELQLAFEPGTFMEHTSENVTYRRLLITDKLCQPRDFWVKWTRLDGVTGYTVSDEVTADSIKFEIGEDVPQKIREKEFRFLCFTNADKYQSAMSKKTATEWRDLIKRAIKRGDVEKLELDLDCAVNDDLQEQLAKVLGITAKPEVKEEPLVIDNFDDVMQMARAAIASYDSEDDSDNTLPEDAVETVPAFLDVEENAEDDVPFELDEAEEKVDEAVSLFDLIDSTEEEAVEEEVIEEETIEETVEETVSLFDLIDSTEEETVEEEPVANAPTAESLDDAMARMRAELEAKIRLEYEERARAEAEEEARKLRLENERLAEAARLAIEEKERYERERREAEERQRLEALERERLAEAARRAEEERVRRERELREAEELRRREEALRLQIQEQMRREAEERERLAEAARQAEERHRKEEDELRQKLEAQAQREAIERDRLAEAARQAVEEQRKRELLEAERKAAAAAPAKPEPKETVKPAPAKPKASDTFTSHATLTFRNPIDMGVINKIQQIIEKTLIENKKADVPMHLKAFQVDDNTVGLDIIRLPNKEKDLIVVLMKALGNGHIGISKITVE